MSVVTATDPQPNRLSPTTRMGAVSLTVADLEGMRDFYDRVVGLHARERADGSVAMGGVDGTPLIILHGDRGAPRWDPRGPGLFHVALLLPTRADLARSLRRLAGASWPLTGASDHLVSEALYLRDPEGNGIEIYRDRTREQWRRTADGGVAMDSLRLDLTDLLNAAGDGAAGADTAGWSAPAGTTVGHVHLQVSDIDRAHAFYGELLGLQTMARMGSHALFVSAGGYHHHIGLNTWNSAGAPPAAPGTLGLRDVEIVVGEAEDLTRLAARLHTGGIDVERGPDASVRLHDPFGNRLTLHAAEEATTGIEPV